MQEQWKEITEFKHKYSVSNLGNIKNHKTGKLLTPINQSILRVTLYDASGKPFSRSIAHIVASEFLSNPNNYNYVTHKNGDHTDNRVDNLMWSRYPTNNKLTSRRPIPVYCVELDTVYESYRDCEQRLGIAKGMVYQYFKSGRKTLARYTLRKLK